jgi:hypothetical protein
MMLGRGFVENDCSTTGGQPVAVLSEIGWTTQFKRDPTIVGRTLQLDNQFVTVIGVTADGAPGEPGMPHVLVPYTQASREYFRDQPSRHAWLDLSGRLAPGKSRDQANAELNVIAAALDQQHPGRATKILVTNGALGAEPRNARGMRPLLVLVLGTTLLVLLMVCTNVTTLLLARATARRHEMAVRLSLGATRSRCCGSCLRNPHWRLARCAQLRLAYYLPRPIAQMLAGIHPGNRVICAGLASARLHVGSRGGGGMRGGDTGTPVSSDQTRGRSQSLVAWRGQTTAFLRGSLIAEQLAISLALLVGWDWCCLPDHIPKPNLGYDPNAILVANIDLASLRYSHHGALRLRPAVAATPSLPGSDRCIEQPSAIPGTATHCAHDGRGRSNHPVDAPASGGVELFRHHRDKARAGPVVLYS